mgnify:CR=1 FL=1
MGHGRRVSVSARQDQAAAQAGQRIQAAAQGLRPGQRSQALSDGLVNGGDAKEHPLIAHLVVADDMEAICSDKFPYAMQVAQPEFIRLRG